MMPKLKSKLQVYALLFCFIVVTIAANIIPVAHFVKGGPIWKGLLTVACCVGMFAISVYMILKIISEAKEKDLL